MDLYNKIEKLCNDRGITITDMCRETGASRGSLGDLKSGKKKILSVETLKKISSYFGLTIDELISSGNQRLQIARMIRKKSTSEISDLLKIDISLYKYYEDNGTAPDNVVTSIAQHLDVDARFIKGEEYVLKVPVSAWSEDMREDYESASDIEKIIMEYRHGNLDYITKPIIPENPMLDAHFYELLDQLTLKEIRDFKARMEETIKNRK